MVNVLGDLALIKQANGPDLMSVEVQYREGGDDTPLQLSGSGGLFVVCSPRDVCDAGIDRGKYTVTKLCFKDVDELDEEAQSALPSKDFVTKVVDMALLNSNAQLSIRGKRQLVDMIRDKTEAVQRYRSVL